MRIDECQHGKRTGKAGATEEHERLWAGFFCPEQICEAVFLRVEEAKK